MGVPSAAIDTDSQPPLTIPLGHFIVGLVFLLVGSLAGVLRLFGVPAGMVSLAHVHLILAGWVGVTIMGAMTQFVPVWSGVPLHSRQLAKLQLVLVATGLTGFAVSLLTVNLHWLTAFGPVLLAGFWVFVYNVGRTLRRAGRLDVTESHFAVALGFFVLLSSFGVVLAVDFGFGFLPVGSVTRPSLVQAHATLAVFGAVLSVVMGALYQLSDMFTQAPASESDAVFISVESMVYPGGVVVLALGRLFRVELLAVLGGVLVLVGLLAFALVVTRRLVTATVPLNPMLARYAVVVVALVGWVVWVTPMWLGDPLSVTGTFGPPGAFYLVTLLVVGFVILGSLYHIVPFIVWMHRYSDRLGFEPVPMIDDLYDHRLATIDFWALLAGSTITVLDGAFGLPFAVQMTGVTLVTIGFSVFSLNVLLTIVRHAPTVIRGGESDAVEST